MLFTQVATGTCHTVALRRDGSVIACGNDLDQRCSGAPPSTQTGFVAVAAGYNHAIALRADGHIVMWGKNHIQQSTRPEIIDWSKFPGNVYVRFKAIDAGENISAGTIDMPEYPSIHGQAMVWGAVPRTSGAVPPPPPYPPYAEFGYITPGGVVLSGEDVTPGSILALSGVGHHLLIQRDATSPTDRSIHGWGMNNTTD